MSNNLMGKISTFVTETTFEQLPSALIDLAKYAIIDLVGVSLGGWKESSVEIVKKVYAVEENISNGATLWGERRKLQPENAAMINGTASHALDFDDAAPSVITHPSAPVLSAIIPLSETLRCSGKDVITAYAVGTEVMQRLGQIVDLKHYQLGWHSTATLGTVGAAAASSYLYGLNREQTEHAIAISASMAGGLQKNFGTMTKPFHVGKAASLGILSAKLAKEGLTGNPEIFSGRGFLHAFTGGEYTEELNTFIENMEFGKPYDLLENGLSFKKFPCCYATHRFIHGVLQLKAEYGLNFEDVEKISLLAPPGGLMPLVHSRPKTGLQGKFSAEYTALTALKDGYVKLSSFEDEQVLRPEIQTMLPSVHVSEMEGETKTSQEIDDIPVEITIHMKNGSTYETKVLQPPGSHLKPLTEQERREKWADCLIQFAKGQEVPNQRIQQEVIDQLFSNALQIETYDAFTDWLTEIHEAFII